jgi:hypothetical protein
LGNSLIARKLNAAGTLNCNGSKWYSNAIGAIIRNEKYAGNSLLQKYYVSDHLTKLKKVNKGELPKYYAENTHPAIVSVETYEQAQLVRLERAVTQGAEKVMYPFTSKIVCGSCGRHYKRKKGLGRFYWQCSTFLQEGKVACPAKQIPESILIEHTDGLEFEQILVTGDNTFAITLSDGKMLNREWQFTSRCESWTDEMREAARQRNLERSGRNNG